MSLLDRLVERLFLAEDSPLRGSLDVLQDGVVLGGRVPGRRVLVRKEAGRFILCPAGESVPTPHLEMVFDREEDLRPFLEAEKAEEFGDLLVRMAQGEKLRLQLRPFEEELEAGMGKMLMELGILRPPEEYHRLVSSFSLKDIAFTQILDLSYLQEVVDELSRITGVRLWVLDMNCMPVVVSTTGGEHCKLIIDSLEGVRRCYRSAISALHELAKTMAPRVRVCHAGFFCFDAPLILNGEMVGMISGDASLAQPPEKERYLRLAEELGIDPGPLLESLDRVRVLKLEEVEFLQSVMNALARVVTEMSYKHYQVMNLYRELERKNLELRSLFHSLTEVQEKERADLSRDLHDATGQDLTFALVNLQMALEEDGLPEATVRHVRSAAESISQVLEKLHDISSALHPPVIDDLGLSEALRHLVRRFNSESPVHFELVVRGEEGCLPYPVKINLFRIAQEALSNVVKHSGADRGLVLLERDSEGITLAVADNGKGMGAEALGDGKIHLGMINMRERAAQIGGRFNVSSRGKGVMVSVHIPAERLSP